MEKVLAGKTGSITGAPTATKLTLTRQRNLANRGIGIAAMRIRREAFHKALQLTRNISREGTCAINYYD